MEESPGKFWRLDIRACVQRFTCDMAAAGAKHCRQRTKVPSTNAEPNSRSRQKRRGMGDCRAKRMPVSSPKIGKSQMGIDVDKINQADDLRGKKNRGWVK
jgi:hypothetical protein